MKPQLGLLLPVLLLGFAGGLNAGNAGAKTGIDPFDLFFDEFGHGFVNQNGTGLVPLMGTLMPDPTGGEPGMVLTYILPEIVGAGDVRVWEDPNATILSDVMRFTDASGNLTGVADRMIYYSDAGDSGLADTGIPAALVPNDSGGIFEVGPEGANGFQWHPGGNNYFGVSDTPEPSSLVLVGLGTLTLAGIRRRIAG